MEARITLGSKMSTAGWIKTKFIKLKASMVRMMVPRLPISVGLTRTTWLA